MSKKRNKKNAKKRKKQSHETKLDFNFNHTTVKSHKGASCHHVKLIPQKILLCLISILFALLGVIQWMIPAEQSAISEHPPSMRQTTSTTCVEIFD